MMTDDLFENSLVAKLRSEGYVAINSFRKTDLAVGLAVLGVSYASGRYTDVCVLPADKALDGSLCKPVNDETLVYVKMNKEYTYYHDTPPFNLKSVHMVTLECMVDGTEIKFVQL